MAGIKLSVLFLATAIFAVYAQDERHGGGRPTQNRYSLYPRLPVSPLFRPALPFRNPWLTPIRNPVLPFRPIVPTFGLPGFRPIYAGNIATPIQPINRPPATVPVQPIIPSNPPTSDNLVVPPLVPGNQEISQNPSDLPVDPISDNTFFPDGVDDEQVVEEPIDPVSGNLFFPGGANDEQIVEEPTIPHWPEEDALRENLFFPDGFDLENEINTRKKRDLNAVLAKYPEYAGAATWDGGVFNFEAIPETDLTADEMEDVKPEQDFGAYNQFMNLPIRLNVPFTGPYIKNSWMPFNNENFL